MNRDKVSQPRSGFTLLDTVLSLFLLGTMILMFGSLIGVRDVNRSVTQRAQAAALAEEQFNALRRVDISTLSAQTNGSFKNVFYNAGNWTIGSDSADSGSHSVSNVLTIPGSTGFSGAPSGRLLFPAGQYTDATLEAKWKVLSDSPAGWAIGYVFRAADGRNMYRVRLAATSTDLATGIGGVQNLVIEKIVDGATPTILDSKINAPISLDTWTTVKLVIDETQGTKFQVSIGGTQQNIATITDTTFTSGSAALLAWGGAHLEVDDAKTIVGATTTTWNFEGSSDLPSAWVRLGLNGLPDSTPTVFDDNGLLTLAPYPNANSSNLLKATIVVQWKTNQGSRSYTATGLIGKIGLGQ